MKVKTLALSQEDQPGIHNSVRKVAQKVDYSKSSVHRLKKSGYKSVKKLHNSIGYRRCNSTLIRKVTTALEPVSHLES